MRKAKSYICITLYDIVIIGGIMSSMAQVNAKFSTISPWLEQLPMKGGETYCDYAKRLFLEFWPRTFNEHLLQVLAECLELPHEVLQTVGHGTIWPYWEHGMEEPDDKVCAQNFIRALERTSCKATQTTNL